MIDCRIEALTTQHARAAFDCGEPTLNIFLQQQANQNAKTGISCTFIATPVGNEADNNGVIAGYYTLSSGSIAFETIPKEMPKRLPSGYPNPAAHIGRLAVDLDYQGQGLGSILLVNALRRICEIAKQIGIHAITVDALNDDAKRFYEASKFVPLADCRRHLYLPIATARQY